MLLWQVLKIKGKTGREDCDTFRRCSRLKYRSSMTNVVPGCAAQVTGPGGSRTVFLCRTVVLEFWRAGAFLHIGRAVRQSRGWCALALAQKDSCRHT